MILLPRNQQPQRFTPINRRHQSANGIAGVINAHDRGTMVGSAGFGPALGFGGGVIAQQGNGGGYQVKDVSAAITQNCTILVMANVANTATANLLAGIGNSGAGNQLFGFQSDTSFAANSTSFRALIRTANGGGITTAESRSFGAGTSSTALDNWLAVYDGTSALKLYRNGVDDTATNINTAASGAVSSFDRISLGGIDRGTDGFAQTGQSQALLIVWNRALSPQEAIRISANPWQIFEPEVIYVKAAAVGGAFLPAWARGSNASVIGSGIHA